MKKKFLSGILALAIVVSCVSGAVFSGNTSVAYAADSNSADTRSKLGVNLDGLSDWSTQKMFADCMKTSRIWGLANQPWVALESDQIDKYGWPTIDDCGVVVSTADMDPGVYKLKFESAGTAISIKPCACSFSVGKLSYNNGTVTTELTVPDGEGQMMISFYNTNGGVKNMTLMRPGCTEEDTFTDVFLDFIKPFSTLRFMDYLATNGQNNDFASRDHALLWSERKTPAYASQASSLGSAIGGSLEYVVELLNLTHKDGWVCVPYGASDDYVQNMARFLDENLDDDLHVYIELSNEVWNWSFQQAQFNLANANEDPDAANYIEEYAKQVALMARNVRSVVGQEKMNSRMRVVMAWQIGYKPSDSQPRSMFNYIHNNYEKPCNLIYALAGAPYFSEPKPEDCTSIEAIHQYMEQSIQDGVDGKAAYIAVADEWDLQGGALCYEGGPHHQGQVDTNLETRMAAHRHEKMRDLVKTYLQDNWYDIGGGLFCYFAAVGNYSKYGCWGLSENIGDTSTPKYQAIMDLYNENKTYDPREVKTYSDYLLAYDGFNVNSEMPLYGLNSGYGFSNAWKVQNEWETGYLVKPDIGLTYQDLAVEPGAATGGQSYVVSSRMLNINDKTYRDFVQYTPDGKVLGNTNKNIWVSYLMQPKAKTSSYLLITPKGNWYSNGGIKIGYDSSISTSNWVMYSADNKEIYSDSETEYKLGATCFITVLYQFSEEGSTKISAWINPEPAATIASLPQGEPDMELNFNEHVGLQTLSWYPGGSNDNGLIDEIRIGTQYYLVAPKANQVYSPVPETSLKPSNAPSVTPSSEASAKPSVEPSVEPSSEASANPSAEPSSASSDKPSTDTSAKPSDDVSDVESAKPSDETGQKSSAEPSAGPSVEPSVGPSVEPSAGPSAGPSTSTSANPSKPPVKVKVRFTKKKVKIKKGKKITLKVKITGKKTKKVKKIKYTVSKKKIVKIVRKKGRKVTIKALKKGKVVLKAKAAGKTAKCKITVK